MYLLLSCIPLFGKCGSWRLQHLSHSTFPEENCISLIYRELYSAFIESVQGANNGYMPTAVMEILFFVPQLELGDNMWFYLSSSLKDKSLFPLEEPCKCHAQACSFLVFASQLCIIILYNVFIEFLIEREMVLLKYKKIPFYCNSKR